jgi:hypothetical protein
MNKEPQLQSPETSPVPTTPVQTMADYYTQCFLVALLLPIRALRSIFCWIWQKNELIWTWFFRLLTLMSVGYLVYDRIYETGVSISSPASDPKNPFAFPFSITNNSHIFTVEKIYWRCRFPGNRISVNPNGGTIWYENVATVGGTKSEISPGGILNISCLEPGKPWLDYQNVTVVIEMGYKTYIFGVFPLHRDRAETFTWFVNADRPQWVRGALPVPG